MENAILTMISSVLGAGVAAFFGVKIAVAEMRRDIYHLQQDHGEMKDRVTRLEDHHFRKYERDI